MISFRGSPKPKFFLTLDRTSSFVGGKAASTNELRFGLEFRKKLKLGIGFGALASDVVTEKTVTTPQTNMDSLVNAELTFDSSVKLTDSEFEALANKLTYQVRLKKAEAITKDEKNSFTIDSQPLTTAHRKP